MDTSLFLLFVPACFAINLAFGPNNLLAITHGARYGLRSAVLAALGRLVGFAAMIATAGLGMGALLQASGLAFDIVKYVGAGYLVWLGIRLLRAPMQDAEVRVEGTGESSTLGALARREFTVAIGNPKAILVFTAFFPQFVARDAYAQSYLLLGATFLALEMVAVAIYAGIGVHVSRMAHRHAPTGWFNRASGSMMIVFGLLLALVRRPAA